MPLSGSARLGPSWIFRAIQLGWSLALPKWNCSAAGMSAYGEVMRRFWICQNAFGFGAMARVRRTSGFALAIVILGWGWMTFARGQEKHSGPPTVQEARKSLWSVQPVSNPPIPTVKDKAWVRGPIDSFVLAKLEEKGFK